MLENTVSVAESALGGIKPDYFAGFCVEAFHRVDEILGFNSIRSNVLHRSSPDFTWDAGEILKPGKSLGHTPIHKISPFFSGACDDIYSFVIFVIACDPLYGAVQNDSIEIVNEEEIAASAYMQDFILYKLRGS